MLKRFFCLFLAVILSLTCVPLVFGATVKVTKNGTVKIEAENYTDNFDPTTGNVTIGGPNPTYISFNANEWVEYDLNIATESDYIITIFAGVAPGSKPNFEFSVDGEVVLSSQISETTSFLDFKPNALEAIHLKKGEHKLRILNKSVAGASSGNHFDYFTIHNALADNSDTSKTEGAYRQHVLPTVIEAEDFDLGKDYIVANDNINAGAVYRTDSGIDVKTNASGFYVDLAEGEKVRYTFDVTIAGIYSLFLKVNNQCEPALYFDGKPNPVTKQILEGETEVVSIYFDEGRHFVDLTPNRATLSIDSLRFKSEKDDKEYITIDSLSVKKEEEVKEESIYGVKYNNVYKELYVSKDGSDDGDGSKDAPFKTIKRAKEETAILSADMTGDIIVNIGPGTYTLTETEVFGPEHGGKNDYNIVYRGTDKENQPIISGGTEITGWEKHNEKLWKAPAENVDDMRNLYINDFPAIRARSKYSYINRGVYDNPDTPSEYDGLFVDKLNFPTNFENPEDMELVWFLEWVSTFIPVEGIKNNVEGNEDKVLIELYEPVFSFVSTIGQKQLNAGVNKRFFMENAFELLDEPGEFFFNKREKTVYYYPFEKDNMENVSAYAGKVEQLIKVHGNSLEEKVLNITFDNIAFRHGVWNQPTEEGFTSIQADQTVDVNAKDGESDRFIPPAQIDVSDAKNINFTACDFACLGSTAISMIDAVSESKIDGNLFRDLSGGAVTIGTWEHAKTATMLKEADMELCSDIAVTNNVIRRVAGEYRTLVPLSVYYEKNIDLVHNHIEDVPYSGITAGWGWGAAGPSGWGNINISYNNVIDVMYSLKDGGNIYTLGPMMGSKISNNYLADSHYTIAGVYTDSGSGHIDIFENVIDCTYGTYWWYQGHNNTKDLHGYDNYSVSETYRDAKTSNTLERHTILKEGEWPQKAIDIKNAAGVLPEYSYLLEKGKAVDDKYCRIRRVSQDIFTSDKELKWIQAEDYKKGGQGIGYYKTHEYYGSLYRPDEAVGLMASPNGIGYVIDRNYPDEWFAYDFTVDADGEYFLDLRAAHCWDDSVKPGVNVYVDNKLMIENYLIPKSPTWNDILEHQVGKLDLKAGKHVIKIQIVTNGFYVDALRIHDGSEYEHAAEIINDARYDECSYVNEADLLKVSVKEDEKETGFADCVGHWAEKDINAMKLAGYVNGVSETEFAPNSPVTKKQAALLIMRVTGLNADDSTWAEKAKEFGIYKADENSPITREELAEIVMKAYKITRGSYMAQIGGNFYNDMTDIGADFVQYVSGAKEEGIMTGDESGNFRPKSNLTRAEAVTVAKRLLR